MCITFRGFADNGLVKYIYMPRLDFVIDIRSDLSKSTGNVMCNIHLNFEIVKFSMIVKIKVVLFSMEGTTIQIGKALSGEVVLIA